MCETQLGRMEIAHVIPFLSTIYSPPNTSSTNDHPTHQVEFTMKGSIKINFDGSKSPTDVTAGFVIRN